MFQFSIRPRLQVWIAQSVNNWLHLQTVLSISVQLWSRVVFLSNITQKELKKRRNILIRRSIGLGQFTNMKPVLNCLNVESIEQVYALQKFYFLEQVKKNDLFCNLFNFLGSYYDKSKKPMSDSFHKQLAIACAFTDCQINKILIN